jgi:serine/threonine protein kinase
VSSKNGSGRKVRSGVGGVKLRGVRGPYTYGQLLCAAIVLFNAVVHALAGLRLRDERARELNLAFAFLALGLHAVAFATIFAGGANPLWHRAAGGSVKLLDFGVAFHTSKSHRTETGMLKGKVAYSAPEYIAGEALDGRADLFSLGVCLYQMVAGERPFDGATDGATVKNILDGRFAPPSAHVPDLPERLERIIVRALARDPAERYQTAERMAADLRAYLDEAGARADGMALARLVSSELGRAASQGRRPGSDLDASAAATAPTRGGLPEPHRLTQL